MSLMFIKILHEFTANVRTRAKGTLSCNILEFQMTFYLFTFRSMVTYNFLLIFFCEFPS